MTSVNLFKRWNDADQALEALKKEKRQAINKFDALIKEAEKEQLEAREAYEEYMADNGIVEDFIEGKMNDYKIAYSKPTMKVSVDEDAVPDEYCTIVRKPKLKEIKEMLKEKNVNWARLEPGASNLNWRMVKKGG